MNSGIRKLVKVRKLTRICGPEIKCAMPYDSSKMMEKNNFKAKPEQNLQLLDLALIRK